MGWFWADAVPPAAPVASKAEKGPPLGCPMHRSSSSSSSSLSAPSTSPALSPGSCPYVPPDTTPTRSALSPATSTSPDPAHPTNTTATSTFSKLNPLNYMPHSLSQSRESEHQSIDLPVDREISSIPKGDGTGSNWEYPSPQQMYNAMLRKGFTDTPAEHVESMVAVHNFLNEGAWAEIIGWERRFARGLAEGWKVCRRGEENSMTEMARAELERIKRIRQQEVAQTQATPAAAPNAWDRGEIPPPQLLRFRGRPNDFTPKAKLLQILGWVYPSRFSSDPPFDRHDWVVARYPPTGTSSPGSPPQEVRYVIDYYAGPPEPNGDPVFYLDVRPAVDSPKLAAERLIRWGGDVWWRASGGAVREEAKEQGR
ncbi:cytochrome c/c1 heme-lyase [Lineolata rhizophorae]|uniref:Holocytochrome c-type synthase n=1 Tax=Lineolata rhizophorae TaxID=578093 RepID=A0A6A6P2H4_9PEZI|nr:cytochrome c/c1 heme-lyase [Lineolata rhizophorae]